MHFGWGGGDSGIASHWGFLGRRGLTMLTPAPLIIHIAGRHREKELAYVYMHAPLPCIILRVSLPSSFQLNLCVVQTRPALNSTPVLLRYQTHVSLVLTRCLSPPSNLRRRVHDLEAPRFCNLGAENQNAKGTTENTFYYTGSN